MIIKVNEESEMKAFGEKLGAALRGGEVIELIGDVGAGKTTLTKGVAIGLGIDEDVQSPTFTISRTYDTPADLHLYHYDFYRLDNAGIMADELHETLNDPSTITIIEWAEIVKGVLSDDRVTVHIKTTSENGRELSLNSEGEISNALLERIS